MRHLSTCTPFLWFKLQIIIVIKCKCWGCRWNCVTPGNGGLGRLLEVCSIQQGSSSMSQPALLPYDPSAFWLLLPFFSAACFRHTSEAKWWVPLTKNYARIFIFFLAWAATLVWFVRSAKQCSLRSDDSFKPPFKTKFGGKKEEKSENCVKLVVSRATV